MEKVGFCQRSLPSINLLVRETKNPFETPDSTLAYWVKSANSQNWANEFECYSGFQRAKFTYQILVSTLDLRRDQTLAKEANRVLLKYRFPVTTLDSFLGNRLDLSHLRDPAEIKRQQETQILAVQARIQRWQREVQSQSIDWKPMIEELQPLLVAGYEKYKTFDSYVNTGVVFHLGYHRFEHASMVDVQEQSARGSAIAVLRILKGSSIQSPMNLIQVEFDHYSVRFGR